MNDWQTAIDVAIRLALACVLGGMVGLERGIKGHAAGVRTQMLVSLGAAVFAVIGALAAPSAGDVTRVVQGIAAGIGFLGAGTIVKVSDHLEVKGLTTASSIWLAAAVGTAAGLQLYPVAVLGTVLSLLILMFGPLAHRYIGRREDPPVTGQ
jgi:putative Mg2+ transporter-C (MgtC) family protein